MCLPSPSQTTQPTPGSAPPAQPVPDQSTLPEEDETVAPEKFVLNPLESDRNIRVGNFYFNKRDYRGALGRYERASKFNPNSAEAFFKIGEAEEKLHDAEKAKLAFKKVVDLAPDSKLGREAKKKLAKS